MAEKTTTARFLFDLENVEMDQFVRDHYQGSDIYTDIALKYWPLINPGDKVEVDDPGEFEKSLAGLLSVELATSVILNEIGLGKMCDYESRLMLDTEGDNLQPSQAVEDQLKAAVFVFEKALDTYMAEIAEPVKKTGLDEGEPLRANGRFILLRMMANMAAARTPIGHNNPMYEQFSCDFAKLLNGGKASADEFHQNLKDQLEDDSK